MRWRGVPPGAYEWRQWDDEAVVFVHATGDTHALSAQASAVLATMRAHPGETRAAAGWLGTDSAAGGDPSPLLEGLLAIGLVQRAP